MNSTRPADPGALAPLAPRPTPTRAQFTKNSTYYFDFVRAFATNLVLIGHASAIFGFQSPIPTGGLGVVLFFLLSGFLIATAALRRWDRDGSHFAPFMVDRCARIFVPFLPALVCVAIVEELLSLGAHGQPGVNTGPLAFVANALLLHDYPLFQAASHAVDVSSFFPRSYNTAEPFWTIPLEFWTYVVFGVFFFVLLRREPLGAPLRVGLIMVAMPVFLWNTFAGGGSGLTLVWVLGAVFGFVWFVHLDRASSKRTLGGLMLALGVLGWSGRVLDVGYAAYDFHQIVFVSFVLFGTLLWLSTVASQAHRVGRAMTLLASYSYSLYLVHNTVLIAFQERLSPFLGDSTPYWAMLAAHVSAFAFYLCFERHYQLVGAWLKRRLDSHDARLAEPPPRCAVSVVQADRRNAERCSN